jgi:hypothetical protein
MVSLAAIKSLQGLLKAGLPGKNRLRGKSCGGEQTLPATSRAAIRPARNSAAGRIAAATAPAVRFCLPLGRRPYIIGSATWPQNVLFPAEPQTQPLAYIAGVMLVVMGLLGLGTLIPGQPRRHGLEPARHTRLAKITFSPLAGVSYQEDQASEYTPRQVFAASQTPAARVPARPLPVDERGYPIMWCERRSDDYVKCLFQSFFICGLGNRTAKDREPRAPWLRELMNPPAGLAPPGVRVTQVQLQKAGSPIVTGNYSREAARRLAMHSLDGVRACLERSPLNVSAQRLELTLQLLNDHGSVSAVGISGSPLPSAATLSCINQAVRGRGLRPAGGLVLLWYPLALQLTRVRH